MQRSGSGLLAAAKIAVVSLYLLVPTLLMADVVIELKDGRSIVIPVDKSDVESVTFSDGNADQPSSADGEKTKATSGTVSSSSSTQIVWKVGPQRSMKYPSDAARKAKDGDIIEIDAGIYHNDYAKWRQDNLTIRGIGGMAHMSSTGLIPNGKGIWIVKGANTLIENVEFSGAMVRDTNGVGIRMEGGDLTLRNTFFHDNEFSILTGTRPEASLEISASRFWYQKRKATYSHGMYIGALKRFTLIGSHVKGTDLGHHVKSRALENRLLYNRIEDVAGGNSSRLIDLSNCGLSFIIGNDMQQAASTENNTAIGYGAEKCARRSERQKKLYVVNNTFINEAKNGKLVNNHAGGEVFVANNLLLGAGKFLTGNGTEKNNVSERLSRRLSGSWAAPAGSAAIDRAVVLSPAEGLSLVPTRQFSSPVGTRERAASGPLDIGSREGSGPGTL